MSLFPEKQSTVPASSDQPSSLQAAWELMSQEREWSNLPEALSQAGYVLYQLLIYLSLVVFVWPITFISMGLLLVKHEKRLEWCH